jgi:hypothetical protein
MTIIMRIGRVTVVAVVRAFWWVIVVVKVIRRDFNPKEPTAAKTRSQPALVGL